MFRRFLLASARSLTVGVVPGGRPVAQDTPDTGPFRIATATLSADKLGPKLKRNVFGQFADHLGHGIYGGIWVGERSSIPNDHGYRRDVLEALRAIKVPMMRWPGGCFADEYRWRDGIGATAKRPTKVNPSVCIAFEQG